MNRMIKATIIILTAFYATTLAASQFDPCDLLTKEEVQTLAGEPLIDPEHKDTKNPLGQKMCLYNTLSSSRLIQISVIRTSDFEPKVKKNGQSAGSIYRTTKEMLNPLEKIAGIGDDAFWAAPGLHILKGDIYILVSVGNTNKLENLELAKRIAEKLLPRL